MSCHILKGNLRSTINTRDIQYKFEHVLWKGTCANNCTCRGTIVLEMIKFLKGEFVCVVKFGVQIQVYKCLQWRYNQLFYVV